MDMELSMKLNYMSLVCLCHFRYLYAFSFIIKIFKIISNLIDFIIEFYYGYLIFYFQT